MNGLETPKKLTVFIVSTCHVGSSADTPFTLSLNGIVVGSAIPETNHCSCLPPVLSIEVDAATLSAVNIQPGINTLRLDRPYVDLSSKFIISEVYVEMEISFSGV